MNDRFALKSPCVSCPFRIGMGERFQLPASRLAGIKEAFTFQCHKTVDYDSGEESEDGEIIPGAGASPLECAGRLAVLVRDGYFNQGMRIAERLRLFSAEGLDPRGEAYESWRAVKAAHKRRPKP